MTNADTTTSDAAERPPQENRRQLLAWALYDWANSAFATLITTFVFAAYFTRQVAADETVGTTLWGNAIAAAGLLVALAGPVLGAVADQGGPRRGLLAGFTLLAVAATAGLWLVRPETAYVPLALVLVAVATLAAELAVVLYNALLPVLAAPSRIGRWSGWGWGLGYVGGLACLALALFGLVRPDAWLDLPRDQAQHIRATFLLTAAWYLVFALPLLSLRLRQPGQGKPLFRAAADGLRQLGRTLGQVRRYAVIARFLIARMLYVDGLATLFAFGGVYAAGTFDMSEEQVLMFGILLNLTAAAGAVLFAWLDDLRGPRTTLLLALAGLMLAGTAVLVVESRTWFWVLGALLGVFVGPAQAAGRSWLARAAP
ncbi:MAG: MFS transporter, partial [Gammaproteobacteria bacterium]|nr:MFS transporter [Gammaproteobacteria bacterium]